jgi:phenylpropionate dioxygenase-like ring-hydroxylating dioxygenase large terminal subunit
MTTTTTAPQFFLSPLKESLARTAGWLGLVFLLSGCQSGPPPEKVTQAFWQAMAQGNPEIARTYTTQVSQYLVTQQPELEQASLQTGTIQVEGDNAKVATVLTLKKTANRVVAFDTVLVEEDDQWKVDYLQTMNNFLHLPFGEIFKSLQGIGEAINKNLQKELPRFEQQLKSFSDELLRQMEEFRHQLEKSVPPEQQRHAPRTI